MREVKTAKKPCKRCGGLDRYIGNGACPTCDKKQGKEWRDANVDKVKKYRKKYNKDNADKMAEYHLKTKYGITLDDYDTMLITQGGGCAICGTNDTGSRARLSVDHDHATGAVRGLLCQPCNIGIGHFKDDLDKLLSAIKYLKDFY